MIKASEMNGCLKGYLVQQAADIAIEKILFDSRKISHPATSLFVPLISDRRNAHTYIHEVYQAGVRCFLVSEDSDFRCSVYTIQGKTGVTIHQKYRTMTLGVRKQSRE